MSEKESLTNVLAQPLALMTCGPTYRVHNEAGCTITFTTMFPIRLQGKHAILISIGPGKLQSPIGSTRCMHGKSLFDKVRN